MNFFICLHIPNHPINTADGSEILHQLSLVGSLSHYLQIEFDTSQAGFSRRISSIINLSIFMGI